MMNTRRRKSHEFYLADWSVARKPVRRRTQLAAVVTWLFLGVLLIGCVWVLLAIGRALGN